MILQHKFTMKQTVHLGEPMFVSNFPYNKIAPTTFPTFNVTGFAVEEIISIIESVIGFPVEGQVFDSFVEARMNILRLSAW